MKQNELHQKSAKGQEMKILGWKKERMRVHPINPKKHTFSITLELNFCTDKAHTLPVNCRITASLKRLSFKSRMY